MKHKNPSETKIMLVDDEENILISLTFLLEKEGYSVKSAKNGVEALHLFKSFQPDLVLLDVMMPEKDGFTVANEIRTLDQGSNTHIIFLTALGSSNDRRIGYLSGADDYIVKPFKNSEILEKILEKMS